MYRLNIFLILLFTFSLSCSEKLNVDKSKYQVMKVIYNNIPKNIPPTPLELLPDSIAKKVNLSDRNGLVHIYAINLNTQDYDLSKVNSRKVNKKDSITGLSKRVDLSDEELRLFNKFKKKAFEFQIDTLLLENVFDENLFFMSKRTISREEQKQYDLTGIISFSDVVFNNEKNKAVITVGTNRGRLDSDLIVYFLDKIENEWKITYYSVIEKS